ncbi:MAG: hypothetical protein ACI83O_000225 [Patescibacteria group bacterium]|jgi:hypothetical protein
MELDLDFLDGIMYSAGSETWDVKFAVHDFGVEEFLNYISGIAVGGGLRNTKHDVGYRFIEAQNEGKISYSSEENRVAWLYFCREHNKLLDSSESLLHSELDISLLDTYLPEIPLIISSQLYSCLEHMQGFDFLDSNGFWYHGYNERGKATVYDHYVEQDREARILLYEDFFPQSGGRLLELELEMRDAVRIEDYEGAVDCRNEMTVIKNKQCVYS